MNRYLTGRFVTALLLQFSLNQSTYGETTSSFDEIPTFGGPSSTGAQLIEDNQRQAGDFVQDAIPGWFAFKDKLMNEYGLAIGINYSTLYQKASDALGEDNAWGGIFQLPASWTLLNRGSKNTGTLVFKAENRHRISTDLAPQNLGIQGIGAASIVGTQFSDKDWMLTNLYWQQRFNEGKATVVAGHIDNTDYLGVYGLINPQTSFMNLSFSTNPTIGIPDQGFGGAYGTMLGRNFYAIAGIMDAAGDPAHPDGSFSNFFDEHESTSTISTLFIGSLTSRQAMVSSTNPKAVDGRSRPRISSRTSTCLSFASVIPMAAAVRCYKEWSASAWVSMTRIRMSYSVSVLAGPKPRKIPSVVSVTISIRNTPPKFSIASNCPKILRSRRICSTSGIRC
jgi:porin